MSPTDTARRRVVRRKKTRPAVEPDDRRQAMIDAWKGECDYRALIGEEEAISWDEGDDDPDGASLAEQMFMDKREAFWVGRALGETMGEEFRERGAPEPGCRDELYARSVETRRILLLELWSASVARLEKLSPAALERATLALQRARVENGWGHIPWPEAHRHEFFLKHVERMAEGFTTRGGEYIGRALDDDEAARGTRAG